MCPRSPRCGVPGRSTQTTRRRLASPDCLPSRASFLRDTLERCPCLTDWASCSWVWLWPGRFLERTILGCFEITHTHTLADLRGLFSPEQAVGLWDRSSTEVGYWSATHQRLLQGVILGRGRFLKGGSKARSLKLRWMGSAVTRSSLLESPPCASELSAGWRVT